MGKLENKVRDLFNQATRYHQENRLNEAATYYKKLLLLAPKHPDALHLLGLITADQGQPEAGLKLINQAINYRNNFPPFHLNCGILCGRLQKYEQAISRLEMAIQLGMRDDNVYFHYGDALSASGKIDAAIAAYLQAIQINQQNFRAMHNLGNCYLAKSDYAAALKYYRNTLALNPNLPETLSNCGVALYELGQLDEAIKYHHQALTINPNYYQAYINLGLVYNRLMDFMLAEEHYLKALALAPQATEIYLNLGVNFKDQNKVDDALIYFRKALQFNPEYAEAEFNEALVLLLVGQFELGWQKYEARLKLKERALDIHYPYPRWQGEDLQDKRLLVHVEQGLGDTLQFIRYLKLLPPTANVTLACQPELVSLFASDYRIIPRAVPAEHFDFQIPLISLPLMFKTTATTVPFAEGYIKAPAMQHSQRLKEVIEPIKQISKQFKVGLVWAGGNKHKNDHNRSLNLELLQPLLQLAGCQFYSLQCGTKSLQEKGQVYGIIDLSPHIKDFADTAILLEQLDLLITVDTSIAHLGGAMAIPTWILLPFAPDFRWQLEREDNLWYRSVRLFRQQRAGDWQDAVEKLRLALIELMTE